MADNANLFREYEITWTSRHTILTSRRVCKFNTVPFRSFAFSRHFFVILPRFCMPHVHACARNTRYRNLFAERIVALLASFVLWHNAIFASSFRSRPSRKKKKERIRKQQTRLHLYGVDAPEIENSVSSSSSSSRFVNSEKKDMQISKSLLRLIVHHDNCQSLLIIFSRSCSQ